MSFSEIFVILLVALVVIKPERLPEITYLIARFIKRCRGWYNQFLQKNNLWM
jgi:Sec-independent protein translocase protein TatA